ncbi:MAG: hypothetical protein COW88_00130 [Candidatus Lloydbacteria bacterium CG22_combo_CG10-13_8_21_14_all_47_15]|uniref:DUF2007 domain-containing protein n=1 Tax=Candidatus Lloydbacteria bacterium CG22_combo_CG10-13_8_21_14_all_47_15 TaxID=1974635 RepID=A0A2H0CW69_9BACT|nr:MAG: hypothetical protein COW88_00130 [Candidatus Lloydbacteria bacterium CG22_combo_CG10-13_8_21_14_all_47_15]
MNEMVKVKNYSNRMDAEVDKALLTSHGIHCLITSDDVGGMRPDLMMSSGGVWVLVGEADVKQASKFLAKNAI